MKVTKRAHLQNGGDGAWAVLDDLLDSLFQAVNSISFGSPGNAIVPPNIDGRYLEYTTNSAADTNDTLNHQLGRVPVGILQLEVALRSDETPNAGRVYWGSIAATDTTITLRCTAASKRVCVLLL